MAMVGIGAARNTYSVEATAVPRELGLIERAEGLRSGLAELRSRLESFSDRVSGNGSEIEAMDKAAIGLPSILAQAEGELRSCLSTLSELEGKF